MRLMLRSIPGNPQKGILVASFLLLLLPCVINGQYGKAKPCGLGTEFAPNLRGIRLGMTVAAIEKVLGYKLVLDSKFRPFSYTNEDKDLEKQIHKLELKGPSETAFYPDPYFWFREKKASVGIPSENEPKIEGVSMFILRFYENSLYAMTIDYEEKDFDWKDSKEFALILSEKFKLPNESWVTYPWDVEDDKPYKTRSHISCDGFFLTAQAKGEESTISVDNFKIMHIVQEKENLVVEREVKRIKDLELEKKRKFRP